METLANLMSFTNYILRRVCVILGCTEYVVLRYCQYCCVVLLFGLLCCSTWYCDFVDNVSFIAPLLLIYCFDWSWGEETCKTVLNRPNVIVGYGYLSYELHFYMSCNCVGLLWYDVLLCRILLYGAPIRDYFCESAHSCVWVMCWFMSLSPV